MPLVIGLLLGALSIGGQSVATPAVSAQSVTALYRVDNVQRIFKLVDVKCVEKDDKKCAQTEHWRVFYRALSLNVSPQKHQILVDDNPPQVGAVLQLTIRLS